MDSNIQRVYAFGNYLKKMRIKRGYSVRQLERKSGISNSYISMLENHHWKFLPRVDVINKLAKGLRIEPYIMYGLVGIKVTSRPFGFTLKYWRLERKLGVNQLAYKAHVDPATISKFEKGQRNTPKVQTVVKLAKALRIPANTLLKATDLPKLTTTLPSTIDLDKLIHGNIRLTWDGQPLNKTDILAINLWFKHRKE